MTVVESYRGTRYTSLTTQATGLENALGKKRMVAITPSDIHVPEVFFQPFDNATVEDLYAPGRLSFGIQLYDAVGRLSEIYGVLRPSGKRPQLQQPAEPPARLVDEGLELAPELRKQLSQFLTAFSQIEPRPSEHTIIHTGTYRTVTITDRIPHNDWWKQAYLDISTNADSLINHYDTLDALTKRVFTDKEPWKRYYPLMEFVERTARETTGYDRGETSNDCERIARATLEQLPKHLAYQQRYVKPSLFRNPSDYHSFLLAWNHKGLLVEPLHTAMMQRYTSEVQERKKVASANETIEQLLTETTSPNVEEQLKLVKQKGTLYHPSITSQELDQIARSVELYGAQEQAPTAIPAGVYDNGYYVFGRKRNRPRPARASYALKKILRWDKNKEPVRHDEEIVPF